MGRAGDTAPPDSPCPGLRLRVKRAVRNSVAFASPAEATASFRDQAIRALLYAMSPGEEVVGISAHAAAGQVFAALVTVVQQGRASGTRDLRIDNGGAPPVEVTAPNKGGPDGAAVGAPSLVQVVHVTALLTLASVRRALVTMISHGGAGCSAAGDRRGGSATAAEVPDSETIKADWTTLQAAAFVKIVLVTTLRTGGAVV